MLYDIKGPLLQRLALILVDGVRPVPSGHDPLTPELSPWRGWYYRSVLARGRRSRHCLKLLILERSGTVVGYYWWDCFIEIDVSGDRDA